MAALLNLCDRKVLESEPLPARPPSASRFCEGQCCICLESTPVDGAQWSVLHCGHGFHADCFRKYVAVSARRSNPYVLCPYCREAASLSELLRLGLGPVLERARGEPPPPPEPPVVSPSAAQADERAMQRYARRKHLKLCPHCAAAIERGRGGNDTVSCRCGHSFLWSTAVPVVPCGRVHFGGERKSLAGILWGYTCPNCTCAASTKLALWRPVGAVVGGMISAAVLGVGASAAVLAAALPAAVVGPLALAYEPLRVLGARRNPLAKVVKGGFKMAKAIAHTSREAVFGE